MGLTTTTSAHVCQSMSKGEYQNGQQASHNSTLKSAHKLSVMLGSAMEMTTCHMISTYSLVRCHVSFRMPVLLLAGQQGSSDHRLCLTAMISSALTRASRREASYSFCSNPTDVYALTHTQLSVAAWCGITVASTARSARPKRQKNQQHAHQITARSVSQQSCDRRNRGFNA